MLLYCTHTHATVGWWLARLQRAPINLQQYEICLYPRSTRKIKFWKNYLQWRGISNRLSIHHYWHFYFAASLRCAVRTIANSIILPTRVCTSHFALSLTSLWKKVHNFCMFYLKFIFYRQTFYTNRNWDKYPLYMMYVPETQTHMSVIFNIYSSFLEDKMRIAAMYSICGVIFKRKRY